MTVPQSADEASDQIVSAIMQALTHDGAKPTMDEAKKFCADVCKGTSVDWAGLVTSKVMLKMIEGSEA